MEVIVANVDDIHFEIETLIEDQVGIQSLPFPGMDKSAAGVCNFYMRGPCEKGSNCPFRHTEGDKGTVCKHWLRGLCKKGDRCEFLHEYDMTKMPECYFYTKFNACSNKECPFLHINPDDKGRQCPWYERGFCRHGPTCRNRHIRRVLCTNYFAGFCPDGPECKFMHPSFALPQAQQMAEEQKSRRPLLTCHHCGDTGHKITHCFKLNPHLAPPAIRENLTNVIGGSNNIPAFLSKPGFKPNDYKQSRYENVTCFKCGEKGHFANKCSKGEFAFLKLRS